MFYENENEKDIIDNSSGIQISEDGVVSWGDVLDDTTDNIISVVDDEDQDLSQDEIVSSPDDEIQINTSDEEPDEEELRRILSEGDDSEISENDQVVPIEFEDENTSDNTKEDEKFDFDSSEFGDVSQNSQDVPDEEVSLRKAPPKEKSGGILPVIIALLVAIVVVGGFYLLYLKLTKDNVSNAELTANNQINDLTAEEIARRANEQQDIPVINEDTESMVQAEETPPEEKKEVVDIKTGGRSIRFCLILNI